MQTKLLLLIAFSIVLIDITSAIVCLPDHCAKVECSKDLTRESCEVNDKSLFKPNGGICGCCPLCVHLLDEGEPCPKILVRGVPPTVQCREGLICDHEVAKCVKHME